MASSLHKAAYKAWFVPCLLHDHVPESNSFDWQVSMLQPWARLQSGSYLMAF